MTSESTIPNLQKDRIVEYLKENKRLDGRGGEDYREVEVKLGLSKNAEGSCSVKFGETEVYVGVKLGITEPYPDSQDEGTFMTSAELSPMASEDFELGPPRINSIELARIIDRGIRESGFIDFKKLCIKEGEKVWQVFLDIYAINDAGNLLDVAGLAALIALGNAKMPVYNEEEEKIEHELSKNPLPLNKEAMAFSITLHKIGEELVVDASAEEEKISDYRITVAVADNKGKPRITAIQKGKEGGISEADMENILKLVEDKWKEMFSKISKFVWGK
ncbi:RNA-binding protein [Candidatus Pacearchaeota archaeon]|nr:RNA-binding protein [Candidatus Pacearchaeota archaeon]|tara:strand:- start:2737 stop:3564 length:828 start_codon:yes stop_codon:yes gene_type:complete